MYYNTKASGARIRELRIAKNFTQDDLAEHMNVSHGYISFIESGKRGCSVDVLIALSNLFGVSNSITGQELLCRGWFLPPNTYDCGSFVVNGTAVVGKEPKKPYNRCKSTQKGAELYEISI